jgi:hypothetical protein
MLKEQGDSQDSRQIFFDPQTKCCTYLPFLPNFLVGMILRDGSPEMAEGRASVERRLAAQIGVTPLGVDQVTKFQLLYRHSSASFGRSPSLRCPHYLEDGGRCGIWRYRNAVCSTWYCKHDRGAADFRFWRQSLEPLLTNVDWALSRWCVLELGVGGTALERVLDSNESEKIAEGELEGSVKPTAYRKLWDRWAGQERQFFEACAARVNDLSWANVQQVCGAQTRLLARKTQEAYEQLAGTTPEDGLRCGRFTVINLRSDVACLSTYSTYDPIEIPIRLLGVLQHFQGQATSEALAAVAARENVNLTPDLVRRLFDFDLLVSAKDEELP